MLRSNETILAPAPDTAATSPKPGTPSDQVTSPDHGTSPDIETARDTAPRPAPTDPEARNPPAPPPTRPAKSSDAGFGSFS